MEETPELILSESDRMQLLSDLFPDECTILGPRNLKKISQETKPELVNTTMGSNMMFGDLILMFVQALEFADTFMNVYKHMKKEEKKPTVYNVINITINNNQLDVSKLNEGKIKEIAEFCIKLLEPNE